MTRASAAKLSNGKGLLFIWKSIGVRYSYLSTCKLHWISSTKILTESHEHDLSWRMFNKNRLPNASGRKSKQGSVGTSDLGVLKLPYNSPASLKHAFCIHKTWMFTKPWWSFRFIVWDVCFEIIGPSPIQWVASRNHTKVNW